MEDDTTGAGPSASFVGVVRRLEFAILRAIGGVSAGTWAFGVIADELMGQSRSSHDAGAPTGHARRSS